jgi:hypothetical protein
MTDTPPDPGIHHQYKEITAALATYAFQDVDTEGSSSEVANSILNSTKEYIQPFLDLLQGTGFMENTVMYYGRYEGGQLKIDFKDVTPDVLGDVATDSGEFHNQADDRRNQHY